MWTGVCLTGHSQLFKDTHFIGPLGLKTNSSPIFK